MKEIEKIGSEASLDKTVNGNFPELLKDICSYKESVYQPA